MSVKVAELYPYSQFGLKLSTPLSFTVSAMGNENRKARYFIGGKIDELVVQGLDRTRDDIVVREFQCLKELHNIKEIHGELERIHHDLLRLGVFEAVDILLDESQEVCRSNPVVAGGRECLTLVLMGLYGV